MYKLADPARVFTELMNVLIRLASVGLIHGDLNEFNVMLSEDYKVSVIDFPQMISTSHINAETLFNRDKYCLTTFFKRRYDFVPEGDLPTLAEIEKLSSLDEDVKASGFSAEVEDECNELLTANQNRDSDESSCSESENDSNSGSDSSQKRQNALETVSETPVNETEVINSENDVIITEHINEKEGRKISEISENRASAEVVEKITSADVDQQQLEAELEENYERIYPNTSDKARDLNEEVGRDLMSRLRLDSESGSIGQRSNRSKASSAYVSTTIPPSVIKQRLQRQSAKQSKRDQCRKAVKHGEASLKTKKKQETSDDIKTSVSAVWF